MTRDLAPPLAAPTPDCSVCAEPVTPGLEEYWCSACGITWPKDRAELVVGAWDQPDAEQCPETVQPHLDNTWIKDDDPRKERTYRCLLAAGHYGHHADPELSAFARGWAG